jgi:hypothetical protein
MVSELMMILLPFMCSQVHALMLFPSTLVSLLLAVHLSIVYTSIKTVQGQPSTLHTAIWVLVNFVAPHVVRYHLRTTAQAQAEARAHAAGEGSMCSGSAQGLHHHQTQLGGSHMAERSQNWQMAPSADVSVVGDATTTVSRLK